MAASRDPLLLSWAILAAACTTETRTVHTSAWKLETGKDVRAQLLNDEAAQRKADEERARAYQRPLVRTIASTTARHFAIGSIADELCARAVACGTIDTAPSTIDACKAQRGRAVAVDLEKEECAPGVEDEKLNACVEEIRATACGPMLERVERVLACDSRALCR